MFGQNPSSQYDPAGYGAAGSFRPQGTNIGGAVPQLQKGSFLRGYRRRLNIYPLLLCLAVPWALFSVMYFVMSFELHYNYPSLCALIVALGFMVVAILWAFAVNSRSRTNSFPEHEPTWLYFLAITSLLAWVLAVPLGAQNYFTNMKPYYDMQNLNEYAEVSVKTARGQQLMDAGIIMFKNGTKLDVSRSMGFKSDAMYCVAPITFGTDKLPTYDFWAVGTDCCSGSQADFHCKGWNTPSATGGLRLMTDLNRPYYRLAVQQAEAAYKIKAIHPLFFTWVSDAHSAVEKWQTSGRTNGIICILSYLIVQVSMLVFATLVLARLGQN